MANYRRYQAKTSGGWCVAGGVGRDGTQQHRSDAPNEPNFDETTSIIEAQEAIQVTANSGALAGLDNGAAQPEEDGKPEQGEGLESCQSSMDGLLGAGLRTPPSARPEVSTAPTPQPKIAGSLWSGTESGGAKPPSPDSSDRACRERSPATVPAREKRQLREEERRAVERMVEDKLKAGSFSLDEILTSAMTLRLPGGRGP